LLVCNTVVCVASACKHCAGTEPAVPNARLFVSCSEPQTTSDVFQECGKQACTQQELHSVLKVSHSMYKTHWHTTVAAALVCKPLQSELGVSSTLLALSSFCMHVSNMVLCTIKLLLFLQRAARYVDDAYFDVLSFLM
jgi:hypothetical protein